MELDDFKNSLNTANTHIKQQQILTSNMIDQMTERKYYSKIKKIAYAEIIGVIICLIAAVFVGLNFYKLDTAFLQGVGIVSILLLLTLSVVSILSLQQFTIKEDVNKPYAETLKIFAVQKLRFYKLQKVNVTLSYLLLVTIIILLSKLFGERDITNNTDFWTLSFSLGYIFLLFYSRWVSKFYKKTLRQTQELLEELQPLG